MVATISRELTASNGSGKKKAKNQRKMERMKEQAEKQLAKMEQKGDIRTGLTFEIMDHLYDPHTTAERAFVKVGKESKALTYKLKLLLFTVVARLMGKYRVCLPGFFSFFAKYVKPSQDQVSRMYASSYCSDHVLVLILRFD